MHTQFDRETWDIPNLGLKLAFMKGLWWIMAACLELYEGIVNRRSH